jgi:two-component system, LytTR family, sensor histidine kinase AlgZ
VAVLSEAVYWTIASGRVTGPFVVTSRIGDSVLWLAQQEVVELSLAAAWHADFLLRNLAIGTIVGAVALRYSVVHYQWRLRMESEARARVAALQARIRPHFLFNSMNTIASFTRTKPELAEQVVEDLADLFRAGLTDVGHNATLAEELELVEQYMRIESLRLGERLRVHWDCDSVPRDAPMPALILQPLVENAVYHGIEPLAGGGDVWIDGQVEGEGNALMIELTISNTVAAAGSRKSGNQMAQDNVRERLHAFFANQSSFSITREESQYVVYMRFPYQREQLS